MARAARFHPRTLRRMAVVRWRERMGSKRRKMQRRGGRIKDERKNPTCRERRQQYPDRRQCSLGASIAGEGGARCFQINVFNAAFTHYGCAFASLLFGLTMAGISTKAAGKLENKRGYNGNELQNKEFSNGGGLELYDFNARTYDQQIGRFMQIDPMTDGGGQETLSPYHFGFNNPVRYGDPDGKCPTCPNISVQGLKDMLSRSTGISKSYTPKEFAQDMGEAAKNPENYKAAGLMLGQFTVLTLVGVMTEGTGSGSLMTVGTRGIRNTVSASLEAGEVSLAARATEILGALPAATQSRTTTAVASATTTEGNSVTLVGSSEVHLRPAQRAALNPGEIPVSGKGHAEVTVLNYAQANNMTVNAVAASRPNCPGCAVAINNAGAVPASPLKVVPTRQPVDATFVKKPIVPGQ